MGILKHLLFWPVTGPLFLADFSLAKVEGVVREELTDDTRIKAELMELQLQLELGDIDDDEYVRQEAALMQQLREVRHWREQFGMGVSGGPVRVQSQPREAEVQPDASADVVDEDAARASAAEDAVDAAAEADARRPQVADRNTGVDIELNLDWD
jgi:hypothetical protein